MRTDLAGASRTSPLGIGRSDQDEGLRLERSLFGMVRADAPVPLRDLTGTYFRAQYGDAAERILLPVLDRLVAQGLLQVVAMGSPRETYVALTTEGALRQTKSLIVGIVGDATVTARQLAKCLPGYHQNASQVDDRPVPWEPRRALTQLINEGSIVANTISGQTTYRLSDETLERCRREGRIGRTSS